MRWVALLWICAMLMFATSSALAQESSTTVATVSTTTTSPGPSTTSTAVPEAADTEPEIDVVAGCEPVAPRLALQHIDVSTSGWEPDSTLTLGYGGVEASRSVSAAGELTERIQNENWPTTLMVAGTAADGAAFTYESGPLVAPCAILGRLPDTRRGDSFLLEGFGFLPSSSVRVTLRQDCDALGISLCEQPFTVEFGPFAASTDGTVSASITVPEDLPVVFTLETDQGTSPIDQTYFVTASGTDWAGRPYTLTWLLIFEAPSDTVADSTPGPTLPFTGPTSNTLLTSIIAAALLVTGIAIQIARRSPESPGSDDPQPL